MSNQRKSNSLKKSSTGFNQLQKSLELTFELLELCEKLQNLPHRNFNAKWMELREQGLFFGERDPETDEEGKGAQTTIKCFSQDFMDNHLYIICSEVNPFWWPLSVLREEKREQLQTHIGLWDEVSNLKGDRERCE